MMKKLRTIVTLDMKTMLLLIEAFFYLGWARFLKTLPFSKIAPSLGQQLKETTYDNNLIHVPTVKNVSNAIKIMSKYTFWESKCLVKAIAGMRMLERRRIDSTLYLGTMRDENGQMIAHAWLRSGSIYISGSEGMSKFTVVGKFAKLMRRELEGERNE
jgi:type IV secretory pathway ATPase VirB11/archaellum biosynthesis ATPase